jgi:putative transposase
MHPLSQAHMAFQSYATRALDQFNIAVGRYVIMPDHMHLFVRGGPNFILERWIAGLKRAISVKLGFRGKLWQPGFFDHVLRSEESYGEKWQYVRDNPFRAGLVAKAKNWPHQGEFIMIDRV